MDENEEEKDEEEGVEGFHMKMDEAKAKKLKSKLEKFMAEVSADLLDDEDFALAKKKITKVMSKAGLPFTLPYLKAFREGYQMSIAAEGIDHHVAMLLLTCTARVVDDLQKEMDIKVDQAMKDTKK